MATHTPFADWLLYAKHISFIQQEVWAVSMQPFVAVKWPSNEYTQHTAAYMAVQRRAYIV